MSGPIQAHHGVVVHVRDLGEADRLVRLLTESSGRITAVARRARSSKRRFAGILDVGSRLTVQLKRGRSGLWVLDQADRRGGPDMARTDLDRISLLAYGCEVCDGLAPSEAPAPKLWRLLEVWLELLEAPHPPSTASRLAFEAKALTFAGLTPALARCAACGEPLSDPAVFDPQAGGALHGRCGGGAVVATEALIELEALRRTPLADTVNHRLVPSNLNPWLLSDFIQHQLGRRLAARSTLDIGGAEAG